MAEFIIVYIVYVYNRMKLDFVGLIIKGEEERSVVSAAMGLHKDGVTLLSHLEFRPVIKIIT